MKLFVVCCTMPKRPRARNRMVHRYVTFADFGDEAIAKVCSNLLELHGGMPQGMTTTVHEWGLDVILKDIYPVP